MLQGVTGKYGSAENFSTKSIKQELPVKMRTVYSNQEWFVNSRLRNRAILNEVFCCGGWNILTIIVWTKTGVWHSHYHYLVTLHLMLYISMVGGDFHARFGHNPLLQPWGIFESWLWGWIFDDQPHSNIDFKRIKLLL